MKSGSFNQQTQPEHPVPSGGGAGGRRSPADAGETPPFDSVGNSPTLEKKPVSPIETGGQGPFDSVGDRPTLQERPWPVAAREFRNGSTIVDRFLVVGEIGRGAMGVVYKCFDTTGGIYVALKTLPPEAVRDPVEMERVRENFRLVQGLAHPHIAHVKTLELDRQTGECYLVMEHVEGVSLRDWQLAFRKERAADSADLPSVPLAAILPILRQVAGALDYAHSQRVVHRDVKPTNIMLSAGGRVKVLDFGLAAQIYGSMQRQSRIRNEVAGSPPYMAPEQWRGWKQDAAADQYSLAVTAYQMLAGRLPFENPNLHVLKEAVLSEKPQRIPGLERRVWKALARALSKRPEDRYASCGEFIDALVAASMGRARSRVFLFRGLAVAGLAAMFAAWFLLRSDPEKAQVVVENETGVAVDVRVDGIEPFKLSPLGFSRQKILGIAPTNAFSVAAWAIAFSNDFAGPFAITTNVAAGATCRVPVKLTKKPDPVVSVVNGGSLAIMAVVDGASTNRIEKGRAASVSVQPRKSVSLSIIPQNPRPRYCAVAVNGRPAGAGVITFPLRVGDRGTTNALSIAAEYRPPRLVVANAMPFRVVVSGCGSPFSLSAREAKTFALESTADVVHLSASPAEDEDKLKYNDFRIQEAIGIGRTNSVMIVLGEIGKPVVVVRNATGSKISVGVGGGLVEVAPDKGWRFDVESGRPVELTLAPIEGRSTACTLMASGPVFSDKGSYWVNPLAPGTTSQVVTVTARWRLPRLVVTNAMDVPVAVKADGVEKFRLEAGRSREAFLSPTSAFTVVATADIASSNDYERWSFSTNVVAGATCQVPVKLTKKPDPVVSVANGGGLAIIAVVDGASTNRIEKGRVASVPVQPRKSVSLSIIPENPHPGYCAVAVNGRPAGAGVITVPLQVGDRGSTNALSIAVEYRPPRLSVANAMPFRVKLALDGMGEIGFDGGKAGIVDLALVKGVVKLVASADAGDSDDYERVSFSANVPAGETRRFDVSLKLKPAPVVFVENVGDAPIGIRVGEREVEIPGGGAKSLDVAPRRTVEMSAGVVGDILGDYDVVESGAGATGKWTVPELGRGVRRHFQLEARLKPPPRLVLDNRANAVDVQYTARTEGGGGKPVVDGNVKAGTVAEIQVPPHAPLILGHRAVPEGYHDARPSNVPEMSRGGKMEFQLVLVAKKKPRVVFRNAGEVDAEVEISIGAAWRKTATVPRQGSMDVDVLPNADAVVEYREFREGPAKAGRSWKDRVACPDWEGSTTYSFQIHRDLTRDVEGCLSGSGERRVKGLAEMMQTPVDGGYACLVWAASYSRWKISSRFLEMNENSSGLSIDNLNNMLVGATNCLQLLQGVKGCNDRIDDRAGELKKYVDEESIDQKEEYRNFVRWIGGVDPVAKLEGIANRLVELIERKRR